jgi:hypothetical protein
MFFGGLWMFLRRLSPSSPPNCAYVPHPFIRKKLSTPLTVWYYYDLGVWQRYNTNMNSSYLQAFEKQLERKMYCLKVNIRRIELYHRNSFVLRSERSDVENNKRGFSFLPFSSHGFSLPRYWCCDLFFELRNTTDLICFRSVLLSTNQREDNSKCVKRTKINRFKIKKIKIKK